METKTIVKRNGADEEQIVYTLAVKSASNNNYFIYTDEFVNLIIDRLYVTKKYNVNLEMLKKNVYIIFDKMFEINSLGEHQTILDNKPLNEIPILEEFKNLIFPCAVRLDTADRRCKDLIIRPVIKTKAVLPTITEYMNAIAFVRGVHKRASTEGIVYADSLRSERTFMDVGNSKTVKELGVFKVNYDGEPFIPVPLNAGHQFYIEGYFFNTAAEEVVKEWVNLLY